LCQQTAQGCGMHVSYIRQFLQMASTHPGRTGGDKKVRVCLVAVIMWEVVLAVWVVILQWYKFTAIHSFRALLRLRLRVCVATLGAASDCARVARSRSDTAVDRARLWLPLHPIAWGGMCNNHEKEAQPTTTHAINASSSVQQGLCHHARSRARMFMSWWRL
jgi:hypothetical protein